MTRNYVFLRIFRLIHSRHSFLTFDLPIHLGFDFSGRWHHTGQQSRESLSRFSPWGTCGMRNLSRCHQCGQPKSTARPWMSSAGWSAAQEKYFDKIFDSALNLSHDHIYLSIYCWSPFNLLIILLLLAVAELCPTKIDGVLPGHPQQSKSTNSQIHVTLWIRN